MIMNINPTLDSCFVCGTVVTKVANAGKAQAVRDVGWIIDSLGNMRANTD